MINREMLQLIGLFNTLIWLYLSLTELLLINSDMFVLLGLIGALIWLDLIHLDYYVI